MRWRYLIPRAVLLAIVWAFFAFFFDPLLRFTVTTAGEQLTGARFELAALQTRFFPPVLTANTIKIANRFSAGKNLVEMDELHFALEGKPLMHRKFVVNNARVSGLKWDTDRADSGRVDNSIFSQLDNWLSLDGLGDDAARLGKSWLDTLVDQAAMQADPRQFESVRLAEQLKAEWTKRFEDYEARVKALEPRSKEIEAKVKEAKGNSLQKFEMYRTAGKDVQQLLAEADRIRKELAALPKTAQADFKRLDDARLRDQQELRRKIQILKLDPDAISDALLGQELKARLQQAIAWGRVAQEQVSRFSEDLPEPIRLRGLDVLFEENEKLPRFLIRSLEFDGVAVAKGQEIPFRGTLNDATSDPVLLGKPAVIQVAAAAPVNVELAATIDRTQEIPVNEVAFRWNPTNVPPLTLGDAESLAVKVSAGDPKFQGRIRQSGNEIDGELAMRQDAVTLAVEQGTNAKGREDIQRFVTRALQGINHLEASVLLTGSAEKPDLKLKSNLGPQLAEGLSGALTQELQAQRDKLIAELDTKVLAERNQLQTMMGERYKQIVDRLNLDEQQMRKLIERVAAQPIDVNKLLRK